MTDIYKLSLTSSSRDELEAIEILLEALGALSIYIASDNEMPPVSPLWRGPPQYGDRLEALFDTKLDLAPINFGSAQNIIFEKIPDTNWVLESQKNLPLVEAKPFSVYGAHAKPPFKKMRYDIELEAGSAFGSGHHATTQGCLMLIGDALKTGISGPCLDIGCGTGILALALARATSHPIIATDIDPIAIRVTRENAKLNQLHQRLTLECAAGLDHRVIRNNAPYGLVVANVLAQPLKSMSFGMGRIVKSNGQLILSGLLKRQEAMIRAVYREHGFVLEKSIYIEEWTSLLFRRYK